MAKITENYEVVYIIDPAVGEEAVAATVEKFKALAEQHSSSVEVEEWGKRRLAYAIDYKTEGRDPALHDRLQGRVRGGITC